MNAEALPKSARREPPVWRGWAAFLLALLGTFLLGLLAASVLERREEARLQLPRQPIAADETDPARWGVGFPLEYESYLEMRQSDTRTKYGGAFPRDYLAETPANVILFAGYGFAKQYQQARGHVYALDDVTATQRVGPTTPATCLTCKSPGVPRLMDKLGVAGFYAAKFSELRPQLQHPIACADCHEPNSMQLRITRPALREAFQRQGRDLALVSHQEMRSLVCAQCHVEYYFRGEGNYLTLPWDQGATPEAMEAYYDGDGERAGFSDWTHAVSQTKMIKMQHPDFEVYSTGVHAYRNIACADCHMPFRTAGGVKYTNHHIQSPLLDIANSCAVCHRWGEDELRSRVEAMQDKVHEGRQQAEAMLARAHFDIAAALQAGATEAELQAPRKLVRSAQLRWDYVAASNGMGFHSPQECMRILARSIDLAGQSRIASARILGAHGVTAPVAYPDFSTKEKAQALNLAYIAGKGPSLIAPADKAAAPSEVPESGPASPRP